MFNFIVLALAVTRLYHLFAHDNGPFDAFLRLRSFIGVRYEQGRPIPTNSLAYAVMCEYCSTIYYALILVVSYIYYPDLTLVVATVLALSQVAAVVIKFL